MFWCFWDSISKNCFDIEKFRIKINKLPTVEHIDLYLKQMSSLPVSKTDMIYDYLLLQSGAFGSKQIWIKDGKWSNCYFRKYWKPNENSNRRYPVNPMMPMPKTLYKRVENIVNSISGKINAYYGYVENYLDFYLKNNPNKNIIMYIDPLYKNTTDYGFDIDLKNIIDNKYIDLPIFISERFPMDKSKQSWIISKGMKKGNISGNIIKKPNEE